MLSSQPPCTQSLTFTRRRKYFYSQSKEKTIKCQYFKNTLQNFLLNFKSNHLLDSLSVCLFKLFLLFVNCKKFLFIVSILCSIWPVCFLAKGSRFVCDRFVSIGIQNWNVRNFDRSLTDWLDGWLAELFRLLVKECFSFLSSFGRFFCFVNVYVLFAWHTVGDTVAQIICYRKTKCVTCTFRHDVI